MPHIKKYLQAVFIWALIIPIAVLNGGFRSCVLAGLGKIALPISGLILCACIFAVAWVFIPKIRGCNKKDHIAFGILWFVLTNLFDFIMIIKQGRGLEAVLQNYNPSGGNLWILAVLSSLFAPIAAAKMPHRR